jgi:hypothetical protein
VQVDELRAVIDVLGKGLRAGQVGIIQGLGLTLPSPIAEKEVRMSKPKSRVIAVRVVGPLAPYARQFASRLAERGYTPLSRVNQLQVMVT